ncbi:MAG TPA: hypothetical protein EYP98_09840, partial [Planctomycetes bacterium]|nr:hypothetical protein [Planctomycetota bacterium]
MVHGGTDSRFSGTAQHCHWRSPRLPCDFRHPTRTLVSPSTPSDPSAALRDPTDYLSLAKRHYENFPVGSWLLPKVARRHLHRIYAFARTADDLAD